MRSALYLTFCGLSFLLVLSTARVLFLPMDLAMDDAAYYRPQAAIQMFAHIILSPLALLLAPLQFWAGLRARRPSLHRLIGYTYALCVLGGGLAALVMLATFRGSLWAATGFAILAVLWLGFTGRAVWLARARRFEDHRRWMMRSAAMTFAAVTLRLIMIPLIARGWTSTETYDITAWLCWGINLAGVELLLWRRRRIRTALA